MIELKDFIKFISKNYHANVFKGSVELLPFNNMQHKIIKENDYDNFNYVKGLNK